MAGAQPYRITTIGELHHRAGLPKPVHPLISVINIEDIHLTAEERSTSATFDFYCIALKKPCHNKFKYGQHVYNFQEGVMFFMAPGQVFQRGVHQENADGSSQTSGWVLYIHPDFLWNTSLAKGIRQYEFFGYEVNEALYLTEKEEGIIINIMKNIQTEYHANMDKFTQNIIISQIDLLLNYSDRFYHRQFLTRKIENHQLLDRLETLLTAYFQSDDLIVQGLPSVQHVAEKLNVSPNYLSTLLKNLTGRNTQQHIQDKMIEKAKEKISTTDLSVSEISYELGFDHPQSFSRLFKAKTGLSPQEFRQSFN